MKGMGFRISKIGAAVSVSLLCSPSVFAMGGQSDSHDATEVMVVTASGFEQVLADAPASITVITQEDLKRNEVSSLTDALRGLQGVNVNYLDARDGKSGNQSISLRGLSRDYTLILIDGVRQNPSASVAPNSFADTQSVFIPPVSAIERIEVIRGPMSTLYGSDALGGVINIITHKPQAEWGGEVSVSNVLQSDSDFGGRTQFEVAAGGAFPDERFRAQIYARLMERSASRIDIPGTVPSLDDNRTMGQNPVGADVRTFGTQLYFLPNDNHQLSIRADYNEQVYDNHLGQVGRIRRDDNGNFRDGYSQELRFERTQLTAQHQGHMAIGTWTTQLSHDTIETKGRTIPQGYFGEIALDGSPRELKLETTILNSNVAIPVGNHVFTVGGQYIDPTFTDGLIGSSISSDRYSLFIQDEWRIIPDLTVTLGARYENDDDAGSEITPRAYAVYHLNDSWTLKGGVSRGFRTPFLEQKFNGITGFGDGGTVPLYGNPDLRNETSTNYEIGAIFNAGGAFSGQVTYFHNELKNLIESGSGANSGRDLNIGEARLQGFEAAARYSFNDYWRLTANYTFIDSEVTSTQLDTGNPADSIASREGDPLISVPEHMMNTRLTWQAMPRVATFLEVEYRSDAYRPRNFHEPMTGGSSQGFIEPGVRDSNEALGNFKGYTSVNLGANWQATDNVQFTAVINNLLNRDFMDYQEYLICANGGCTESATGFSNRYNSIQEPLNLYVGLRLQF